MSGVQFNLVPDSKMVHVRTSKQQNLVFRLSLLAAIALAGLFILLILIVEGIQRKQLSDADKQITTANQKLGSIANLNEVLTVQNQLNALPTLHSAKHVTSRLANYLTILTPTNVHIGAVAVDITKNTMTISGTSDSQHSVNVFVDTLKFTTYTVGSQAGKTAFPSVVESSFSLSSNVGTYELQIQFDPTLFSNNLSDADGNHVAPQLKVPSLTTTRSVFDDPGNALFNGQSKSGSR